MADGKGGAWAASRVNLGMSVLTKARPVHLPLPFDEAGLGDTGRAESTQFPFVEDGRLEDAQACSQCVEEFCPAMSSIALLS